MKTRLWSEQLVKQHFPHLRYVRIRTEGRNTAVIYAWNDSLQLPDQDTHRLKHFAGGYFPQVCFQVKPYDKVRSDRVPQAKPLPEPILQAALDRKLNQEGMMAAVNRLFPCGLLHFMKYDSTTGIIFFGFHSITHVREEDRTLISGYLEELLPVGFMCQVDFFS
ncbi:hypothetical protein [Paenibacillus sp. y28]|uniref:hypothetical protein n=1 Tax=Paenibacillus sp. y28 TaxID=3129110 RepID=UPI003018210A